jgi:hypothetical protein
MRLQSIMIDGVDRGDALFTPVIGFTFPVIGLAVLSVAGLWLLARRWPVSRA